ncbi:putative phage tail component, N-terminal domain-containing protein [Marininema mesophilum]|uniref:Putative phage tail component, N-terminal domain-containing protein n=1 Tax=Marininema mesophilum TaxID=1048340 RepID=A0A1H3BU66_9BACL|nr:distal tail protein Dit [Marininema mesophilum]SDX44904.1 putative phage tail component, N-terminal domain-containing protein [Marininema mesophilum]
MKGYSLKFAGKHMEDDFGLIALDIVRSLGPEITVVSEKIPGRRGEADQGIEEGALEIKVPFYVAALGAIDLRAKMRQVRAWLRNAGQLGQLELEDEPGKTYLARWAGSTGLEELGGMSQGEITFYVPDPDAIGETATQRIAGLGVGNVASTASDFATGTLTNLVTETVGDQTDLVLQKYSSWSSQIKTQWETGTMSGMMKDASGFLTLQRGAGATLTKNSDATFSAGTLSNVVASSNSLKLSTIPKWLNRDDLSAWKSQKWSDAYFTDTRKGSVSQQSGYMRIAKTGTGTDSTVMVTRSADYTVGRTILLCYRTTTTKLRFQVVVNGSKWDFNLPNTSNAWLWYRVEWADTTTLKCYPVGSAAPYTTQTSTPTSSSDRYGFLFGDSDAGTADISAVYYGATTDIPPLTTSSMVGTAIYTLPLDAVGVPGISTISFDWDSLTGVNELAGHAVTFQVRVTKNGQSPGAWSNPLTSGSQVPGIAENTWGPGDKLDVLVTLQTSDFGYSPALNSLSLSVSSAYVASGTWSRTFSGLPSHVLDSTLEWDVSAPTGTSVECWVTWTINGEIHGPSQMMTSGEKLPYITKEMDLSTATLTVELKGVTSDPAKSPILSRLYVETTPGYKTNTEGSRDAPGVPIGAVGVVGESRISWEEEIPDSAACSIQVFVGFSETGPWLPCVNGNEIPGATSKTDITGKTLYVRVVLKTADPKITPRLNRIAWKLSQEIATDLMNQGTAHAQPYFYGTFGQSTKFFAVVHIQSGRKLHLDYPFKSGDKVAIDCRDRFRPEINGSAREGQKAMSFDSRMIELHPGYNSFEIQPAGVGVFFCDWRERWL